MIQEAFTYVEQTPDLETKLKLIDTLRTVTAGKVKLAYAASIVNFNPLVTFIIWVNSVKECINSPHFHVVLSK